MLGTMALNHDNITPAAATVLTSDPQTGLPTLIRLCTDLNSRMHSAAPLALIVCAFDCLPPGGSDALPAVLGTIIPVMADVVAGVDEARLYRAANESFALVLPAISRIAALKLAEHIRQQVECIGNGITATLAVASAPHDAGEAGALLAVCEVQLFGGPGERNRVFAAGPVETLPPAAARLVNLLVSRMIALIELGEQLRETEQQAFHDSITGLPNARALDQTLRRMVERCAHTATPLGLLLVDGDHLKEYNNQYSYNAGNEWIRSIARIVAGNLRPGDFVARWMMGDEFVVLLPNAPRPQVLEVAERLRHAVEDAGTTSQYPGTISIGAICLEGNAKPEAVLEQARHALSAAKGRGRNAVTFLEMS